MVLALVFIASAASMAQAPAAHPEQPAGVVYFFFTEATQPFGVSFGQPSFSIYCDNLEIAKVKSGTFLGVHVPAGRHTFASKGFRNRLDETAIHLGIEPGAPIFIRLEPMLGGLKNFAHLRVVDEAEGRLMVSTLAPVDGGLVKRPSMVTATLIPTRDRVLAASTDSEPALTNQDIVTLKEARLGDRIVEMKIHQSAAAYDVSEAALATLRSAGVSDAVIGAMIEAVRRKTQGADGRQSTPKE